MAVKRGRGVLSNSQLPLQRRRRHDAMPLLLPTMMMARTLTQARRG
jgi:hypothetical protein